MLTYFSGPFKGMVFCYIVCIKSKTFLVVSPRFWLVRALERLPTWKFDLRDLEGQSFKVGSLEKARTTQNRGQTSKKVTRYRHKCNRRFCCIFGQRLKPFQLQSLNSSVGRECGSHAAALCLIPSDCFAF